MNLAGMRNTCFCIESRFFGRLLPPIFEELNMAKASQISGGRSYCAVLVIGLLCASAAYAPPQLPFPPIIFNQPFAAVGFAGNARQELVLEQDGPDFTGCVQLKVVNNIPMQVMAHITATEQLGVPAVWSLKLNEPGETEPFKVNVVVNKITSLHEPGAAGDLELCVKVQGVGPRWYAKHIANGAVQVARVVLTIMPTP